MSPIALKAYYVFRDVDSEFDLYWWFGDSSFGWLCPLRLTAINVKALSAGLSAAERARVRACVRECVRVYVCVYAYVCVCARARSTLRAQVSAHARAARS